MDSFEGKILEEYDNLQKLTINPKFNLSSLKELKLCNNNYRTIPSSEILIRFSNLRSINLSHNQIERFTASNLVYGAPLLEELDLSHNNIKTLDDIIELGSLQFLRVFTFLENPILPRYLRVKLVELLLFPYKYRTYDPVQVLLSTYVVGPTKPHAEKWKLIGNKTLALKARSASDDRNGKDRKNHKPQFQATNFIKLCEERCPTPRKTRFPMLTILNEEIISIHDLQCILMTQDISSILPDKNFETKIPKTVRFEKLHEKYIKDYMKRKERKKEEIDRIPSLRKIADTLKEENDLKLIFHADHLSHMKRKHAKPDYEGDLWKKTYTLRAIEKDFFVETRDSGQESEESEGSQKGKDNSPAKSKTDNKEKDMGSSAYHKTFQRGLSSERILLNWSKKKKSKLPIEDQINAKSSDNSSVSERDSPQRKNLRKLSSNLLAESESNVSEHEDLEEDKVEELAGASQLSLTLQSSKLDGRGRSLSVPKFARESAQSKRVSFIAENSFKSDREDLSINEIKLFGYKRATSLANSRSMMQNDKSPELHDEGSQLLPPDLKLQPKASEKENTRKRFIIVEKSTPNLSLPFYAGMSKSSVNLLKTSTQLNKSSNNIKKIAALPLDCKIIKPNKEAEEITTIQQEAQITPLDQENRRQSSTPYTDPSLNEFLRTNQSDKKLKVFAAGRAKTLPCEAIEQKANSSIFKINDGIGFELLGEFSEIPQTGRNLTSAMLSKESFLTPVKRISVRNSSPNKEGSSINTFESLSPTVPDRSPSKDRDLSDRPLRTDPNNRTFRPSNKEESPVLQRVKLSPPKLIEWNSSTVSEKAHLKEMIARKKAQKIKEHHQEASKMSKVIFLNRSNSMAFVNRNEKTNLANTFIQQQQQQQQKKFFDLINAQRASKLKEEHRALNKLVQVVTKQSGPNIVGSQTDRPSFYFAKTQTGSINRNKYLAWRSQQEHSSDLKSPSKTERTRMRTEEDTQPNFSWAASRNQAYSFMVKQTGGSKIGVKSSNMGEMGRSKVGFAEKAAELAKMFYV